MHAKHRCRRIMPPHGCALIINPPSRSLQPCQQEWRKSSAKTPSLCRQLSFRIISPTETGLAARQTSVVISSFVSRYDRKVSSNHCCATSFVKNIQGRRIHVAPQDEDTSRCYHGYHNRVVVLFFDLESATSAIPRSALNATPCSFLPRWHAFFAKLIANTSHTFGSSSSSYPRLPSVVISLNYTPQYCSIIPCASMVSRAVFF